MPAIKVYYNSACPVCKAGIEGQQCALRKDGDVQVEWLDVHANPQLTSELGADIEAVRERLHVVGADGGLRVGSDAFAVLYAANPRRRWLGRLLTRPVFRQISALAYDLFARGLYRWNRALHHW